MLGIPSVAIGIALAASMVACQPPHPTAVAPGPSHTGEPGLMNRTPTVPGEPSMERPWPTDPRMFTFAVIGDKTGGGEENWPIFDRAVEELNLQRPDFVLMVGDLIQGYTEDTAVLDTQWAEFHEHASNLDLPFVPLPGNHDVSNPTMLRYWKDNLGLTHFSFDYKGCHFLFLCTDEATRERQPAFGEEQIADVLEDLASSADARHTFVLMHRPAWLASNAEDEWQRIEDALGNRKYTVFAGHYHNLKLHQRNDRRYFVLAATGAGMGPSEVKELGSFHHYTSVTVEGDSAHVALVEPGNVWPPDISTPAFAEALREGFRFEVANVPDLAVAEVELAAIMNVRNTLRDTLRVQIAPAITGGTDWAVVRLDTPQVVVAPGDSASIGVTYVVPTQNLAPPAELRTTVWYGDRVLSDRTNPLPLDQMVAVTAVSEWSFVGPFDAGAIDRDLVRTDPRSAMPGVYADHGPQSGWSADATYGPESLRWRTIEADERGTADFAALLGRDEDKVLYALCGVYSPTARNTFGMIRVNDYADVLVNGAPVNENRVYQLDRGAEYFPMRLDAGWNTVVVKVVNLGANWWLRLSVGDPTGDLRFAAHPE